jgi:hypothetical protein
MRFFARQPLRISRFPFVTRCVSTLNAGGADQPLSLSSKHGRPVLVIEHPALQSARMTMQGQAYGRTMIRPFIHYLPSRIKLKVAAVPGKTLQ